MAHNSTNIYSPVEMPGDLEPILGVGRRADGYYHIEDYCKCPRVNKFSRYHPLIYPQMDPITDAQRESVHHGITLPSPVTGSSINLSNIADACSLDWGYQQPTGGNAAPYRESDFCKGPGNTIGYYHNAVPPIQVNYPRDGWTFLRGSNTNRSLIIYVDLDPDDSAINLQSTDFVASGLNLNEWTLIAWVDSNYMSTKAFASDDTILNAGEISGNTIVIRIPNGTGSWSCDVYICMYRYNSGRYEFMPLPKQGDYNPEYYTLNVVDDAQQSGGGVPGGDTEEMFKNVWFSSELYGTYRTAWDCTDNGAAKWCLRSSGSLYVEMNLKNTANSASTIDRSDFELDLNGLGAVTPTTLYNSNRQSVSSITIPAGGTVTCYMFFDAIFNGLGSDWNNSNKNSSWSMDFTRNGATLFGGDLYAMKGSNGWVER